MSFSSGRTAKAWLPVSAGAPARVVTLRPPGPRTTTCGPPGPSILRFTNGTPRPTRKPLDAWLARADRPGPVVDLKPAGLKSPASPSQPSKKGQSGTGVVSSPQRWWKPRPRLSLPPAASVQARSPIEETITLAPTISFRCGGRASLACVFGSSARPGR